MGVAVMPSGTRSFSPSAADLVLNAFSRCGKSAAQLTAEHMMQATLEANLLNTEWGNKGVILWESVLFPLPAPNTPLNVKQYQLTLPASVVALLAVYVELQTAVGSNIIPSNIPLGVFSTTEYAALNNPQTTGRPTTYWWDRQIISVINLYPIPDVGGTYFVFARVLQQIQDVVLPAGVTLDMPNRFFDAFTSGMAKRLSVHFAPERFSVLETQEQKAWDLAVKRGGEDVSMNFGPQLGSYFRN
jgi:hypothetical protein